MEEPRKPRGKYNYYSLSPKGVDLPLDINPHVKIFLKALGYDERAFTSIEDSKLFSQFTILDKKPSILLTVDTSAGMNKRAVTPFHLVKPLSPFTHYITKYQSNHNVRYDDMGRGKYRYQDYTAGEDLPEDINEYMFSALEKLGFGQEVFQVIQSRRRYGMFIIRDAVGVELVKTELKVGVSKRARIPHSGTYKPIEPYSWSFEQHINNDNLYYKQEVLNARRTNGSESAN
jgi:hypothetical protein